MSSRSVLFVLVAAIASPTGAYAASIGYGAYVSGAINNGPCAFSTTASHPDCAFSGTDPRFWGDHGQNNQPYMPASSAAASRFNLIEEVLGSASLATGDLYIEMTTFAPSSHVNITAFMWDTLTFDFPDSDPHLVTAHMSGSASTFFSDPTEDGNNMGHRFELAPCCPDPNFSRNYLMGDGHVWFTDNGPYHVSSSLMVTDGMSVSVIAMLFMFGGGNSSGVAFDPITLDIAGGGTFTSASGVFLSETVAVPEPSVLLLLATGVSVARLRRRARCR
jgi:prepilin-type processing-associated H-X9-DG protein